MENPNNNGEELVVRDENGRVVSGVLNPEGRPKGARNFTKIVEEALLKLGTTEKGEKVEIQKALGEKVVRMALEGNEQMIKLIWNYLDGLPKASLELDDHRTDETKDILKGILDKMNGIKPE